MDPYRRRIQYGRIWLSTSSGIAYSNGLKNSFGKGKYLIITYIARVNGFIEDVLWNKKNCKLPGKMNWTAKFEEWSSLKILIEKIEEHSVITIDNFLYHCRKIKKISNSWKKKISNNNYGQRK